MKTKHVYQSKPLDSNGIADYTKEENETWSFLLHRQNALVQTRASKEFLRGVQILNFLDQIPQHEEVTSILKAHTGWGVEPVPALIQPDIFLAYFPKKNFQQLILYGLQKI